MRFEDNTLLFGFEPTPRIVAIEMGDTGTVKVYRREKNGSTICETEEFHPFVWADGDVADLGLGHRGQLPQPGGPGRSQLLPVPGRWPTSRHLSTHV